MLLSRSYQFPSCATARSDDEFSPASVAGSDRSIRGSTGPFFRRKTNMNAMRSAHWPPHCGLQLVFVVTAGCGNGSSALHAPSNEIPPAVTVPSSSVTMGFAIGTQTTTRSVAAFRISKYPTTVAQYSECIKAGACEEPKGVSCAYRLGGPLQQRTYAIQGADNLPMTCTSVDEAQAYCAWTGGQLPTQAQWELAARGPSVARYAWGGTRPTCLQRADIQDVHVGCRWTGEIAKDFAVGTHPAGASKFGVEDVLSTPGELIHASADSDSPACRSPFDGCVVYGLAPGAIDGIQPLHSLKSSPGQSDHAQGFRCVWTSGGAQ
jgi:formylglycine-generating enzyme required for sulfatase activity